MASKVLSGVRMEGQLADYWCWSAVTQSMIDFFKPPAPTQDQIATAHIKIDNIVCLKKGDIRSNKLECGANGACKGHCNDFHMVRVVLEENGRFADFLSQNGSPSFADIKAEIDENRPVVCRINWNGGTAGHFVAVIGWTIDTDGIERVHVLDPLRNEGGAIISERVMSYSEFVSQYSLGSKQGFVNFSYKVQ